MAAKFTSSIQASLENMLKLQEEQEFSFIYDEVPAHLRSSEFNRISGRVVYLVNSRTSEIEWVEGDIKSMFDREASQFRKLTDFYEHIDPAHVNDVIGFTTEAMKWTFSNKGLLKPFNNRVQVSFNLRRKRTPVKVTRNTYIAHQDSSGAITHSLGIFELNSNNPGNNVLGNISGPHSESFEIRELAEFRGAISNAEIAVLREVAMGLKNSEIAEKLHLSVHTVETHRKNMIRKLEARNTPNLVYIAQDLGLI